MRRIFKNLFQKLSLIQNTIFSIVFLNSMFTSPRPKFWIIMLLKKTNQTPHSIDPQLFICEFSLNKADSLAVESEKTGSTNVLGRCICRHPELEMTFRRGSEGKPHTAYVAVRTLSSPLSLPRSLLGKSFALVALFPCAFLCRPHCVPWPTTGCRAELLGQVPSWGGSYLVQEEQFHQGIVQRRFDWETGT